MKNLSLSSSLFALIIIFHFLFCDLLTSNAQSKNSPENWATYNRTYNSQRYSPLTAITKKNAASLALQFTYDTGDTTSFETGPLAIDGVLYFTTEFNTYAVNGATGQLVWKHNYPYSPGSYLKVNRGVAYLDGKLFRGAGNGHVYALNATNGKLIWDVQIADPKKAESVPAAPIAWKGKVFIGNAGGDNYGVLGRVYALNAETGKTEWTFYVVPNKTKGNKQVEGSWPSKTELPRAGGATWTSYTLDTEAGILYIPGGNPAPDFSKGTRKGSNLYTNSVVAVNASTGQYLVHYQLVPEDFHDWDVASAPVLLKTAAGRNLIAEAPKDGNLYGIDRTTGKLLYKTPLTRMENTTTPITQSGTHFCPGTQGGAEWNGPAYNPSLNLLFVNTVDWCATVRLASADAIANVSLGQPWTAETDKKESFGKADTTADWAGWLTAVNADNGKVVWKYKSGAPMLGGVTATATGLVFAGELTNDIMAFDAATGKKLWHYNTGAAIGGGIITYAVNGRQYVAVASGMESPIWPLKKTSSKVLVFALP